MTPSFRSHPFSALPKTIEPIRKHHNSGAQDGRGGRFASSPLRSVAQGRESDWDKYQVALAELGQHALSEHHLPTLCYVLAQAVATTLQVSHCRVWQMLSDGVGVQPLAAFGWEREALSQSAQLVMDGTAPDALEESSVLWKLLRGGKTVRLGLAGGLRETLDLREFPLGAPLSAVGGVVVAIPGQGSPLGVLEIYTPDRPTITYDDEQFLHAVANIIAAAIERKRSEALLQAQTQVLELVAGGTELYQVYDNLCGLLAQEAPGAMCSIMVLNAETQRLHMRG